MKVVAWGHWDVSPGPPSGYQLKLEPDRFVFEYQFHYFLIVSPGVSRFSLLINKIVIILFKSLIAIGITYK